MERLTVRNSDGTVSRPLNLRRADVLNRLAAYEDTGLTPEEVSIVAEMFRGDPYIPVSRAAELVSAERADRLVMLPCKRGARVYKVQPLYEPHTGCDHCLVGYGFETPCAYWDDENHDCKNHIGYEGKGLRYGIVSKKFTLDMLYDFGKTVFLTRDEAEAALEEQ